MFSGNEAPIAWFCFGVALQVVQYLLANNYYLTALELLVESQQAGHGEQVQELQVHGSVGGFNKTERRFIMCLQDDGPDC